MFSPRYQIVGQALGLAPEAFDYLQARPPVFGDDAAHGMSVSGLGRAAFLMRWILALSSSLLSSSLSLPFPSPIPFPFPSPFPSPLLSSFPSPFPSPSLFPPPTPLLLLLHSRSHHRPRLFSHPRPHSSSRSRSHSRPRSRSHSLVPVS